MKSGVALLFAAVGGLSFFLPAPAAATAGSLPAASKGDVSMEQKTVLELPHQAGNPRNSEGAFITLKDGRIMFIYTKFYGDSWSDHAAACLAARYSDDNGDSWTAEDEIVVPNEGQNVMSVSLLRLADGRLAMVYLRKALTADGYLDCRPQLRHSADEGKTWSEPVSIIPTPGYYVGNNDRLVQLKNGRLLYPVALHRAHTDDDGRKGVDIRGIGLVYYSDDNGDSWREAPQWLLPPSRLGSGFQEPGVVELSGGRLMIWFRTNDGAQYTACSGDQGLTWETAVKNNRFRSSESPMSIKRDPEHGDLIAVWNDHSPRWAIERRDASWRRTPLVLARSADEGETWHDHQLLESEPDHGYCYIAIEFVPDGLLLAYCCGGGRDAVLQDLRIKKIYR